MYLDATMGKASTKAIAPLNRHVMCLQGVYNNAGSQSPLEELTANASQLAGGSNKESRKTGRFPRRRLLDLPVID
jgi:hypothetical protein